MYSFLPLGVLFHTVSMNHGLLNLLSVQAIAGKHINESKPIQGNDTFFVTHSSMLMNAGRRIKEEKKSS